MLTTKGTTSPISELNVDDTPEREELRATVAKLARSYGRAYLKEVVKEKRQPTELWNDLGKAGFLGVHLPEEFGGGGGGLADLAIVIEENAAAGIPLFMIVISPSIAGPILAAHGTTEQKQTWLPGIASGERKVAFSITEPDAGLNTHNITTTATPRLGGGWSLNGQKYWTSGADEADALLVVARSDEPDERGRTRLSLFLVPTDTPGIVMQEIDSALALPEKQFVIFYDNVEVSEHNIIGTEHEGLRQVFAGLNPERIAAAAVANGIGRYAIEAGTNYAANRQVWSTPIGAHQGVAHPLARSHIEVQSSRLLAAHAAHLFDAGFDAGEASNMAKFCAGQAATNALDRAIQVHGGNGLSNEFGLSDLWFVARMFRTAPVSEEMILNHVAQHSLGLPKSY
jgi:alkylation response protein AidB-like acyl-CoA dehydrogenase